MRDNGGFYLGDDQLTLAEILRDKGFRTGGFVGAFVLDRRWGIAQGFDRYFDDFDLDRFANAAAMDAIQRPGSEVVDRALEWLQAEPNRPFFAWVHLYDAHTPYEAPGAVSARASRERRDGAYDAEIAYADAQVGRLLDALRADGRLDDTLVVVVADHGEMLGEHGEQTHGFFIYEAATRIPLIVSGPGVPAAVVADQVRIVDVMPTALSLLGVPVPNEVQGANLMPLARGEQLGAGGAHRELVPAVSLRLERAALDSGRALQADPRAAAGALRPGDRSGRGHATDRRSPRSRLDVFGRALDEFESPHRESGRGAGAATDRCGNRRTPGRARVCRRQRQPRRPSTSRPAATPRTRSSSTTC